MRICRYRHKDQVRVGFYDEQSVVPVADAAKLYFEAVHERIAVPDSGNLLDYLPGGGEAASGVQQLGDWVRGGGANVVAKLAVPTSSAELLVPIPRPNKLFLLAGNYADHIREGGGIAAEREETFPYVFMKPPSTTLTDPGKPVRVPSVSPNAIDWECELAVVMGKGGKRISQASALSYVAGYTVINDISDRKFRPNPGRKKREKDSFFDWLHGKWHDSFCPCGPCITSSAAIPDPQKLSIELQVNDKVHQDASTAQQIFSVAGVIEFISSFVTLEPGDIISTGTPAGVGNTTGTYLKPGDKVIASIGQIGSLSTPIVAET